MRFSLLALPSGLSALAALVLLTSSPSPVNAGLKHSDNIVFQQLADLTRPDSLKHHPGQPFGSIEQSSQDLPPQVQGVDWKVTKTQFVGRQPPGSVNRQYQGNSLPLAGLAPIFSNGQTEQEVSTSGRAMMLATKD